ncbi:hypothetical protein HP444_00210 [Curtobacterium luteum]|nr:hypothetical protein [Curtobacterium luteum]
MGGGPTSDEGRHAHRGGEDAEADQPAVPVGRREEVPGADPAGQCRDPQERFQHLSTTGPRPCSLDGGSIGAHAPNVRGREEYVLTDAGRDLAPVLLALGAWADRHHPSARPSDLAIVDRETDEVVVPAAVVAATGRPVPLDRLAVRGV